MQSTIDTFRLPEIFKYDQIIDKEMQLSICSEMPSDGQIYPH